MYWLLGGNGKKVKWGMKEDEEEVYEEKVGFVINMNEEVGRGLRVIEGGLKELLEWVSWEDCKYERIEKIWKEWEGMKKLLKMVLEVGKMEVKESRVNIEKVGLKEWIEEVIGDLKGEGRKRKMEMG